MTMNTHIVCNSRVSPDVYELTSPAPGWRYLSGDGIAEVSVAADEQTFSFPPRALHNAAQARSSLYVLNGRAGAADTAMQDTYRSDDDGRTWVLVNSANGFGKRYAAGTAVVETEGGIALVVCGGMNTASIAQSSCWSSIDASNLNLGRSWSIANAAAPFNARAHHSMITIGHTIILFAGIDAAGVQQNDGQ